MFNSTDISPNILVATKTDTELDFFPISQTWRQLFCRCNVAFFAEFSKRMKVQ